MIWIINSISWVRCAAGNVCDLRAHLTRCELLEPVKSYGKFDDLRTFVVKMLQGEFTRFLKQKL